MNTTPKISVVTVCYNAADDIEKTIRSVTNQTYPNIEYLIIDGASKDGTMDVVNRYKDKIACIVSEPDKGIYDAMNKGIDKATGEWINFMNAGDCFAADDVVSKVVDGIKDDEKCGVVFGAWYLTYHKTKRLISPKPFYLNNKKYKGMGFSHQAVFVKTDLAKKHPFDAAHFKIAADYNMIKTIYDTESAEFKALAFPVAMMNEADGATIHNFKRQLEETAMICGCEKTVWLKVYICKTVWLQKIKRTVKYILFS